MIIGIGIDLVDLTRIKEVSSNRFVERILSDEEKNVYDAITSEKTKLTYLGGRFASKEAIFKAIGHGPGKTNYKDFSILNQENGSPYVKTSFFTKGEIIHISISHTDNQAISYVMIEKL